MTTPFWQTPAGFLGTLTERKTTATSLVATGTNVSYSIITGRLPTGLYLNTTTGLILGTPGSVSIDTSSTFVVRAANTDGIRDRTFNFNVIGPSAPVWVTFSGPLPVGMNGEYFTFNKEYVDYKLRADTDILTNGNTLKYYISDNEGQLPPGLKLTTDGRIYGYINDNLAIDIEATINGGYDTETYDFYPYAHNVITEDQNDPALNPKSINKIYQFWVTVTDGVASSRRKFSIEVTDPDSLRADNSIISVDEDMFDASAGYLLAPIWQNKYGDKLPKTHNLGSVRANKQQVISLYDYDPYNLQGPAFYEWSVTKVNPDIKLYSDSQLNAALLPTKNLQGQTAIYFKNAEIFPVKGMKVQLNEYFTNFDSTVYTITGVIKLSASSGILNLDQPLNQRIPDSRIFYVGTVSAHPPGITLDSQSGVLSGQIPYQPSYSNGYRFTINVVKIDQETAETTLLDATGSSTGRIVGKVYATSTTSDYLSDLPSFATYTGEVGDILLVGTSYDIIAERDITNPSKLLPYMDGTTYAYAYCPTTYPAIQYSANDTGTIVTLSKSTGIEPQVGWIIKNNKVSTVITSATNTSSNYWSIEVQDALSFNDNNPTVSWTMADPTKPAWAMIGQTVSEPQIYLLNILGEIPSGIQFISTSSLGVLTPGEISEIAVKAENTNTNYSIEYELVQGQLPNGLILNRDGTIQGKVTDAGQTYFDLTSTSVLSIDGGTTTIDRNWWFTIRASDVYRLSSVEKEFYISVYRDTVKDYTRIYVKPFLSPEKRMDYKNFASDPIIFDPALLYRPNDPEFGVQQQIKMVIETGIEQLDLDTVAEAMNQYFYRKKFYFGGINTVRAQDEQGNNVYEIIYVEIVDDQMLNSTSPSYAVSVGNMRAQLESITIDDSVITVNDRLQPKYMTTLDPDTGVPLGFIKAVPICYTIPGGSTKILSRLKNAISTGQFDFKNYHFDTDRIIVETVKDTGLTNWVMYPTERR